MTTHSSVPVVMTFAGTDPTGGAGIQADIEALASHGCHAAPVVTATTIQDTHDVKEIIPVDSSIVLKQARAVLEDTSVAVFKLGMLGSLANIESIHRLLRDYPQIPVVLDPILASGSGTHIANNDMQFALRTLLFPLTTVLTPNTLEAKRLAQEADSLSACGMALLDDGCEFVLITGTHENTEDVLNVLYGNHRRLEEFRWQRLPGSYHGSGCTLAASIAGLLAQGNEPFSAIHEAQEYTWESLKRGYQIGMGQNLPNRFFWAQHEN